MEKHKVICPYCGAGCQFNLLVQNCQVVGTEPLNGITNQSELCLKGMSGYDFINDTKILTPRVLHPMIRRTKGADLERVSWDEALDFTASKMQAIIDEYGPYAVMTTGSSRGGGNEANYVMPKRKMQPASSIPGMEHDMQPEPTVSIRPRTVGPCQVRAQLSTLWVPMHARVNEA